ncbi:MAG: PAS domain-containing protein [Methanospirillum sp.]|nr:PAS domain-containing protein [Methanospirillum sp.]
MDDPITRHQTAARILDLLAEQAPRPVPIRAVAGGLGIDRRTAAKYLDLLAQRGDVTMQRFGQKKLYRPSRRVPLGRVFDRLRHAIMILDAELEIRMVNASLLDTLGIPPGRSPVGTRLDDLDLPILGEPAVRETIGQIRRGLPHSPELQVVERGGDGDRIFLVEFETLDAPGGPDIVISLREITALRRAESDLADTERKMATLFDSLPNGVILFDGGGAITYANRAALRVLGLHSVADLRNASVFDIACYRDRLPSLVRAGRLTETELACDFDKLGRERGLETTRFGVAYFEVVFTPIRTESGGPPREYAILFKDITARRRAERELKERLQGISTNLPGIVYQFYARDTGEWGVYYVDERSDEILGLAREPLKDWFQRLTACIAPEDREEWEDSIHDVVRRVAPWHFEGLMVRPGGGEMFLRGISKPIRLQGEIVFNGIFFDITDRKRAEEALTESHFLEMRYRSFFEDACNGVLIYRPVAGGGDLLITDVNRVAADLLRVDRADLIGLRLFEVFPEMATPEVRGLVGRVLATGRPEVARPARYRDRDDFPWISRYVFRLPSGELASFMIDVSEALEEDGMAGAGAPFRIAGLHDLDPTA